MGNGDEATLTVACRFTSLDQWLTTHVGPSWKVKHVKVWLLAKCLGIPLASSLLDDSTRHLGLGTKKRSASPITFAPDPRRRPVSPIRFAKGNQKRGRSGHTENDQSVAEAPKVVDKGDDDYFLEEDVVGFDEDDDDFLSDREDDAQGAQAEVASIPSFITDTDPGPPSQAEVNLTNHPAWMKYNSDAKSYTLVRFSTGQILEDEYSLSWYELSPYELLELHAHQPVQNLPPSFSKTPGSGSNHASHSSTSSSHHKHRRAASLYSVAGSDSHSSQITGSALTLHRNRLMAPLNRQKVPQYVQPYWEGYVRALRVVWKEDTESVANFQNGYGLGYVGAPFPKGGHMPGDPNQLDSYMGRKQVLVWSLRWIVIKDGQFCLCKTPEDTSPTHVLPLDSLISLRNSEQLFNHSYFTNQQESSKPPFMRSPYPPRPPKDKSSRKDKDKNKSKDKSHDILSLADPKFTSPKSHKKSTGRSHMSNMSLSMSSTMSRESTASDTDEDAGTAHDNNSDFWGGGGPKRRGSLLPKEFSFGGAGGSGHGHGYGSHPSISTHHSNGSGLSQSWSEKSGLSNQSRPSRLHLIDGEPIDDLKIVCIKYNSSNRVRAQMGSFSHGDLGGDVDEGGRGGHGGGGKDGRGGDTGSLWRSDTEKKGKGRGKTGKLLRLGKDDKNGKEKSKKLKKDKERDKGKGGDWISALAGGSKGKEKAKEDTSFATTASSQTLINDPHPSTSTVDRLEYPQPSYANDDRDNASTIQGSIYYGEHPEESPTSPGGAIRFARFAKDDGGLDSSDDDGEDIEDEGDDDQYDTYPAAPTDEGLSLDLHAHEDSLVDPDTSSSAVQTHVQVTSDVDPEAEEADAPRPTHTRAKGSISSHTHPHEELQELEHDASSDIGSSPKFAHSDNTEEDLSDTAETRYRQGYRYGYQYESYEAARWGQQQQQVGGPEHEMLLLHEHEDRMQKEKVNLERRRIKELARKKAEEKENEKHDWIVLDMGTDLAFQSFLRILHRHLAPPVQSSFVNIPNYTTPHPSRTPTPTRTPYPSPISPRGLMTTQPFQWTENPELDGEDATIETKSSIVHSSSVTIASAASTDSLSVPRSPGSTCSQEDRLQFDASSQHPPALAALSSHPPATADSLGVLPYPEWRIEVTERAQRAGVGEIGRGLKWVLWQDQHQLDLDLHEVNTQETEDEEASTELKRLRRETLSLKNRRRSSASAAPTITGGKSTRSSNRSTVGSGSSQRNPPSQNLTIYDSDVSEDTGKLIDDTDSETSEAEWVGWTADLHRQYRIQEQRKKEPKIDMDKHRQPNVLYPPRNIEEDRKSLYTRRRAMEPTSTVVTAPPVAASSTMTTPAATLYTASSSESLRRRTRNIAFSPVEGSSPTHMHSSQHSHSSSQLTSPQGGRRQLAPGTALSHSTSMYGSGLRSSSAAIAAQRRPSMPSLIDTTAANSSRTGILRSPGAAQATFPTSTRASAPFSPTFSSFSLGEAASKDHKGKGRASESSVVDGSADGSRTPRAQRPKLSLTTTTSPQPTSIATADPRNTAAAASRSILRHAKSNSSFAGPASVPEEDQHLPSSSVEQRTVLKKKKTRIAEKIAKKLDSAIDFVDGGW